MAVCSDKTWKAIVAITECRGNCKAREQDLVRTRKELKGKLAELGPGDTAEHLRASRDYVRCVFEIDLLRDRTRSLADKVEAAIAADLKGEEFDFDAKDFPSRIDEAEIFHNSEDDEEDEETESKPPKTSKGGKVPAKTPPLPGLNTAAPSTDLINKGATFPGEFKIMRVDNRATTQKVASSRENLAEVIEQSIGGPYDLFKFETGDVFVRDAVILRVTFVGPAGPLADPKTATAPKGSKPNAKTKKAADATQTPNQA